MTQLQQAITYETALGLWRRLKGSGARTMGVLFWQLNDVWLVCLSHSSVDDTILVEALIKAEMMSLIKKMNADESS